MKVKTAEQYAERFKRRGDARKREQFKAYIHGVVDGYRGRDVNQCLKPDHGTRAQRIDDVFAGRLVKPQKPTVPNVAGIPLEGEMGSCGHVLVGYKPYVEPEAFVKNTQGRIQYIPFAYPCIVDHGMKRVKRGGR